MFWPKSRLRRKGRSSRHVSRPAGCGRQASFEALDSRRVLSGVTFIAGVLSVDGTNDPDIITIAPTKNGLNVQVTINGQVSNISPLLTAVNEIDVTADKGDDLV